MHRRPFVSGVRAKARLFKHFIAGGALLAAIASGCSDDPIVYPNRNLRPTPTASAGSMGIGGVASIPEAGGAPDTGGGFSGQGGSPDFGGAPVGSGGKGSGGSGGSGASLAVAGDGPNGLGGETNAATCGNGVVESGETCDDFATDPLTQSGDGCSSSCQSSCETCEKLACPALAPSVLSDNSAYDVCYRLLEGDAVDGPATNIPRVELCRDLIDCVHREHCGQLLPDGKYQFLRCWCDLDWDGNANKACQTAAPTLPATAEPGTYYRPGRCAREFQEAAETDLLSVVNSRVTAGKIALGAAMHLLNGCDTRVCVEDCAPESASAVVATITADLSASRNGAGESALGDLLADAARAAAQADVALLLGSSICATPEAGSGADDFRCDDLTVAARPGLPADSAGKVLRSEARAVVAGYGFGVYNKSAYNVDAAGELRRASLSGAQLRAALNAQSFGTPLQLFVSGVTYAWDPVPPEGSRVVALKRNGSILADTATVTVAYSEVTAQFIAPLAELTGATVVEPARRQLWDRFADYLAGLPTPLAPPVLDRITLVGAP